MSIKSDVMAELETVGTKSKPTSQDISVNLVHAYNVATLGEAYFKKAREKAKDTLLKAFSDIQKEKVSDLVVNTKMNETGDVVSLIENDVYTLQVRSKNGATYLDMPALKTTLAKKYKLTTDQIEALIDECTDRRDPTLSYEVVER